MDHDIVKRQKAAVAGRSLTAEEVLTLIAREVDPLRERIAKLEGLSVRVDGGAPVRLTAGGTPMSALARQFDEILDEPGGPRGER